MSIPVVRYENGSSSGPAIDPRWWDHEDPSRGIVQQATKIEADQSRRRERDLIHASLYANQPLGSLYQLGVMRPSGTWSDGLNSKLTWNIAQVIVDAASAKISKNRPRPIFLTMGGDWKMKKRAKGLSKFCEGLFDAAKVYPETQRCFVDGCVFDAGVLKIYPDEFEIQVQRTLPAELLIDDTEAVYGKPRSIYQKVFAHRDLLIEAFGSEKTEEGRRLIELIKNAKGVDPSNQWGASDMVQTYEAWHLGSGKKSGRHVICIDGAVLFDEKWTKTYFPFAWFRWNNRLVGMWGQGLVEQLVGIQMEITKLLARIQASTHLMSVPRIYVQGGTEMPAPIYVNGVGTIVRYTGDKPTESVAQAMSPEVYTHLERLYAKAFETALLSHISGTGLKPAGLDAAVALREYHDIENEGFVVVGQRYEQMHLDAARIMIDQAADLYENRDYRVKAPGTRLLEEIAWRDVKMTEDKYSMRAFPVSLLPTTPSGKLQKVQEMVDGGFLDKETGLALLDFPDIEDAISLQTAALEDVQRTINDIVEYGKYETPEPAQNLPLLLRLAQSAYLKGRNDALPEKRLELLLRLMSETKETMAQVTPPPPVADPTAGAPGLPAALPAGAEAMPEAIPPEAMAGAPAPMGDPLANGVMPPV